MILLFLTMLLFPIESWSLDRPGKEENMGLQIQGEPSRAQYGTTVEARPLISGFSEDPSEEKKKDPDEYTPKRHPVLSKSIFAKRYTEFSTVCCFFSKGWFRTGSFLAGVTTTGLAGLAYGVSDPILKNKLNLSLLILTVATAALRKFETYAIAEIKNDENEYKIFLPEIIDAPKNPPPPHHQEEP